MLKFFGFISLSVLLFACVATRQVQSDGLPPYKPQSQALHDTIARLDSLFFEAYNNCRLDVMASLISEDLEFYHDHGGLTRSKTEVLDGVKKYVCGITTRELLPGSLEVYPIPNFGAVQIGAHRFINHKEKSTGRYARFVHTWQNQNGQWKLTRVISLH